MTAQASQGATKMIGDVTTLWLRLANAAIAYVKYLEMTFWPVNLAVFYPYEFHPRPVLVVASVLLLATVTVVALWFLRRATYLAVGWFWYLCTLVPTIGLVQVGAQALADRYTYIPSIGIFLALVWAAADLIEARRVAGQPIRSLALRVPMLSRPYRHPRRFHIHRPSTNRLLDRQRATLPPRHRRNGRQCRLLRKPRRYALEARPFRGSRRRSSAESLPWRRRSFVRRRASWLDRWQGKGHLRRSNRHCLHAIPDDMERAKAMNDLAHVHCPAASLRRGSYRDFSTQVIKLAPKQPGRL